jgi:MFS transporter, NNP family, nitrate/nitrite transporter
MNRIATRLSLLSMSSVPMRVLHLTWMIFFVCFFPWFAVAALMPLIRDELHLSKNQLANNVVAVLVTISVVSIIGRMCDHYGARRAYSWLLSLGGVLVIGIAFVQTH